jgi:hypothetical protein
VSPIFKILTKIYISLQLQPNVQSEGKAIESTKYVVMIWLVKPNVKPVHCHSDIHCPGIEPGLKLMPNHLSYSMPPNAHIKTLDLPVAVLGREAHRRHRVTVDEQCVPP